MNCVPWSVSISSGNPTLQKMLTNASATVIVSILLGPLPPGIWWHNLPLLQCIDDLDQNMVLLVPPKSMATPLNGSLITGIFCKGAFLVLPLGSVF